MESSPDARVRALVRQLAGPAAGDAVWQLSEMHLHHLLSEPAVRRSLELAAQRVLEAGALGAIVALVRAPDTAVEVRGRGALLLGKLCQQFEEALLRHRDAMAAIVGLRDACRRCRRGSGTTGCWPAATCKRGFCMCGGGRRCRSIKLCMQCLGRIGAGFGIRECLNAVSAAAMLRLPSS
jgi:hypothetical protein